MLPTTGVEDNISDDLTSDKTLEEEKTDVMDKNKAYVTKVYNKVRSSVIKLLFPTSQTLKFKIKDGEFTVKIPKGEYENRALETGDRVIIVPFQQSKKAKSSRKFGYAVITPSLDNTGNEIKNSYRTVAVLSDAEIDKLKDTPETKKIFNDIENNELRDKDFVSLLHGDISSEDGFKTSNSKDLGSPIAEGTVQSANTIKYFFGKDFRKFTHSEMGDIINKFIDSFYANQIENDPSFRQSKRVL